MVWSPLTTTVSNMLLVAEFLMVVMHYMKGWTHKLEIYIPVRYNFLDRKKGLTIFMVWPANVPVYYIMFKRFVVQCLAIVNFSSCKCNTYLWRNLGTVFLLSFIQLKN